MRSVMGEKLSFGMLPDLLRRTIRSRSMRNASSALSGQVASKISFLASMMLFSRFLPDGDLGSLLLAVAISQVGLFLSDMGVSVVLTRKLVLSDGGAETLLGPAFAVRGLLWLAGSSVLMTACLAAGYSGALPALLAVLFLSAGLDSFSEQCYAVFRARERMAWEGSSRAVGAAAGLGFAVACYLSGADVVIASLSFPLRSGVSLLLALSGQRRLKARVSLGKGWPSISRAVVAESFSMGLTGLLFVALQRIDSVFIEAMLGTGAVGAFQQCYRIADSLVFLVSPTLLPGALFPGLCRALAGGSRRASVHLYRLGALFLAIALLTALPVAIGGERFLRLVWGPGYLRGMAPGTMGSLLSLTMVTVPVFFLMHLMLTSLIAIGRQKAAVLPVTAAILLSAAGYRILIPEIGLVAVPSVIIAVNLMLIVLFGGSLAHYLRRGAPAAPPDPAVC